MSEEKTEVTNLVPEEKPNTTNDNKESNQTENFRHENLYSNGIESVLHVHAFSTICWFDCAYC